MLPSRIKQYRNDLGFSRPLMMQPHRILLRYLTYLTCRVPRVLLGDDIEGPRQVKTLSLPRGRSFGDTGNDFLNLEAQRTLRGR